MTRELMRALAAVAALAAIALPIASCGGDDNDDTTTAAQAAPGPAVAVPASQEFATPALAGDEEVPEPPRSGTVVADLGFDLRRDGFSFENYGLALGGPGLRAQEMQEMFGDGVCAGGTSGAGCQLTPAAERWRQVGDLFTHGGHCYGFAVLSLMLKSGAAEESAYGGSTTYDLKLSSSRGLVTNAELEADLSRDAVTQFVPVVLDAQKRYTPNEALDVLRRGLSAGTGFILSLSSPGKPGHAVVPIRVEDMGGGQFDVVLYDNNFPYIGDSPDSSIRRLHIDTKRDRWAYQLSALPDAKEDLYSGVGDDNPMTLGRAEDNRLPLPCPVCGRRTGLGATTMVGLTGDVNEHGHLRISDADGNVTGYENGELVNEIPGAEVVAPLLSKIWLAQPEPVYMLPSGGSYKIELVDVPDDAPEQTIHAVGGDLGVGLSGLSTAAEGTTLRVAPSGGATLAPSGEDAVGGQLTVAAGNREVRVDPSGARVQVRPTGGDVVLRGSAERVTVVDASNGRAATVAPRTGRLDLGRLVGRG